MIWLYRCLWIVLGPVVDIWFIRRLFKGKEDKKRFKERLGVASMARPAGKLVWFHGSSVGETLSILPLIHLLLTQDSSLNVLVTSGTRTSARLMAERLPERAVHQYVPLDFGPAVYNFLQHWQPDASVFVESEFWPELLYQAPNPILINARISKRSFRRYKRFSFFYGPLVRRFQECLAQSEADAQYLLQMGAVHVQAAGNLKYDAPPLACESEQLEVFNKAIDGRPVFVASSTHDPEEEWLAAVHQKLTEKFSDLLTIIVPRHPERGEAIATALTKTGLCVQWRTSGQLPAEDTQVYIADSLGEMGLWYTLSRKGVAFIGGSLIPHGGQNPWEAVQLGTVTLCGPHMHNFTDMLQQLKDREIIFQIDDLEGLIEKVAFYLENKSEREKLQKRMAIAIKDFSGVSEQAAELIFKSINRKKSHVA